MVSAAAGCLLTLEGDPSRLFPVAANLIRSLALNIRYDNGRVTCVTGCGFTTFIMDKSVEGLWDTCVRGLLSGFGIDFEEV